MTSTTAAKRPAMVTFLAALIWLIAIFNVGFGVLMVLSPIGENPTVLSAAGGLSIESKRGGGHPAEHGLAPGGAGDPGAGGPGRASGSAQRGAAPPGCRAAGDFGRRSCHGFEGVSSGRQGGP